MITIVLAGRNDDYGGAFQDRVTELALDNGARLTAAGVPHEFLLVEWNPLPDRPLLSRAFVERVPSARTVVVPRALHDRYSLNPHMPFHEMPAKNAGIRRAAGDWILVTNADIVFGDDLIEWLQCGTPREDTLYRAHRVDVPRDLPRPLMTDPSRQLPSGEGQLPPCYYLGAGGDFCFGSRALWHGLGGFDERIRFSTRGKDWQFFLGAAARDVPIAFVGTVYHLDHEEGFRNTPPADRDAPTAHFGASWDIEFGLPLLNPPGWGLHDAPEHPDPAEVRIHHLDAPAARLDPSDDRTSRLLETWLRRPADARDETSAGLLHGMVAAFRQGRRLRCRLTSPQALVALAGLAAVAERFGVEVCCNHQWPVCPGLHPHAFVPEPANAGRRDLIVEETSDGLVFRDHAGVIEPVLPARLPVDAPAFAPVMGRRLLRAYLRALRAGVRRLGIYGAGGHTTNLLRWGVPETFEVGAIAVTGHPSVPALSGIPVHALDRLPPAAVDALLLSSATFEPEMLERASAAGFQVLPLYGDWPTDFWRPVDAAVRSSAPVPAGRWQAA